jgi:hypothetical protein
MSYLLQQNVGLKSQGQFLSSSIEMDLVAKTQGRSRSSEPIMLKK